VLEACQLRYRPILMTSAAFIFGVLPLAAAQGAGAEIRQAIGVAVLGGMLGVTFFGILFTPVWFIVVDRLAQWGGGQSRVVRWLSELLWWGSGVGLLRWVVRQGYRWLVLVGQAWRRRLAGVASLFGKRPLSGKQPSGPTSSAPPASTS